MARNALHADSRFSGRNRIPTGGLASAAAVGGCVSGLHIVLLSSGFDCVARRLLDACGIFNGRISVIAQTLECDASGRARVEPRVVLKDARSDKRAHLEKYLAAHGLDISQTAAFDDHTDDERLFSGMCRVWRISDDETLENAALELEPLLPQERQA